jgi:hypothetical protein
MAGAEKEEVTSRKESIHRQDEKLVRLHKDCKQTSDPVRQNRRLRGEFARTPLRSVAVAT